MKLETLIAALALLSLTACGQSSQLAAANLDGSTEASLEARGRGGPHLERVEPFAELDLTADQRAQLKAIAEKYRPAPPTRDAGPPAEHPGAAIQALLTADTIDAVVLKAALENQSKPEAAPKDDNRIQLMVESRAVLTEAQRASLIEKLSSRPAPGPRPQKPLGDRPAPMAAGLALTAEQQAAFEAFKAKMEANRPQPGGDRPDPAAHLAAEIAFWQTGDTSGLEADQPPLLAVPPAFPVDEFVAFAASLTVEQRRQVFARGMLMAGPGGPRG